MKHRHLNHEEFTLAAIDDIIEHGLLPDWEPLFQAIERDPFGEVARKTLVVCANNPVYGASLIFEDVVAIARQRALADRESMATSATGRE